MRVTANTFPNELLNHLNRLALRQTKLQTQAATGQRLRLPEDDPTSMRRVMDLQQEANSLAQYRRNIQRQQELAAASFEAIKALKRLADRAGEIATRADDLKSPEERRAYAIEIDELIRQAVQLGNTKNRGDHLFAGTKTDTPPFQLLTDADGRITGVSYQGNANLAETEIAQGVTLSVQVVGANTTGAGPRGLMADSQSGADLFAHLISLRDHLTAGDTAGIVTDREQLAKDAENFIFHIGTNGALQARLETTAAIAQRRGESLSQLMSKEADADLAQTLVQLNTTQTAYQAALQTGGMLLNSSLLDYLR
jgi:flagellar hook-associated protein 3 FlgL